MTPTTFAQTILADVPRYSKNSYPNPTEDGYIVHCDDVLAALTAAMDPALSERAGEVLSRLRKADEYEPLGHDGWEAADLITALLAQNAALRAERDAQRRDLEKTIRNQRAELRRLQALERVHWQSVERWRGTREGLEGKIGALTVKLDAAEAQNAALTARVERLTGALKRIGTLAPIEKPPEPYDENGWQVADTSDRHASMVAAKDMWEVADFARAALSATTEEGHE